MGREFELKYAAAPETLERIRQKYCGFARLEMRTTYYDIPSGALAQRRWTLRLRMENGIPVCTLKTSEKDGARGEWETECDDIMKSIPILIQLGAPEELAALTAEGLLPTCGVRFTRLAAQITTEDAVVELALDQGEFLGNRKNIPFAEVEVELKQGADEAAIHFGEALAREFGLKTQTKSKFRRALELAAEEREELK